MQARGYDENYQIQVNGIGAANILTISQAHQSLGLSRKECLERILSAPSILSSGLNLERATKIENALKEYQLPCEIVPEQKELPTTACHYEVACYIRDFSKVTTFAAELAAFLGQTSEEIIASLTQVPAVLIGRISEQVALDIIERFSTPGIELIASNTETANYTVLAFMLGHSESVRSQYIALGLTPKSQDRDCTQWMATDLDLAHAQPIWQKCSELHLPVSIQNHDYLRFDLSLTDVSALTDHSNLCSWLEQQCGVPSKVHAKLLRQLPVVLKRGLSVDDVQDYLQAIEKLGCKGEAHANQGMRFNLEVSDIVSNQHDAFSKLLHTLLRKQVPLNSESTQLLELAANIHQAQWIAYEAKKAGIKVRLIKTTDTVG